MAPVEVTIDYYAVLEIPNTATPEFITKSYRRLAKVRHPDKNPNKDSSTAVFQLVSPITFQNDCYERRQRLTRVVEAPERL